MVRRVRGNCSLLAVCRQPTKAYDHPPGGGALPRAAGWPPQALLPRPGLIQRPAFSPSTVEGVRRTVREFVVTRAVPVDEGAPAVVHVGPPGVPDRVDGVVVR